jgi:hypothetical protein
MLRREKLARTGTNLQRTLGVAKRTAAAVPPDVAGILESAAKESAIAAFGTRAFDVSFPAEATKGKMSHFSELRKGRAVHMLTGKKDLPPGSPGRVVAVVATLQDGQLVHLRRLHSR